jgi:type IV fimbrial biogenesis protein FimT
MTISRNPRHCRRQRGMTLVEQIMVLAIMAVLAGIAAPPLRSLLNRNLLQVAQTDFIAALQHARQTAIFSGKRTLFCPSHDGGTCCDDTRWDNGWLLGHDANVDDQPDKGPLYTGPGYGGKLIVRSSAGRHLVRFRPDGSASGSNITLVFCQPHDSAHALSVVVSNSGRIRGAPASAEQAAACVLTT